MKQDIAWVDSDTRLESICEQWQMLDHIAVDTEFLRTDTYYPIAGLIQINDGQKNYLIDPKTISDFYPLSELFDREDLVVAMHSCSEDLEVFQNTLGSIPRNIMDTQIACALVGYGFSVGYARAIKTALDIDVPKGETRSDWLARPLSDAQLRYAAMDVEYLYTLSLQLIEKLKELDRWLWLEEDCKQLKSNYKANQNTDAFYLRIKSAWRLNSKELTVLQALAKWREEQAQIRDMPRNRIIKEPALIELAKSQPKHISELRSIDGITERMIKSFGQSLVDIVSVQKDIDESDYVSPLFGPLNSTQNKQLKRLRAEVETRAEMYDLPTEILVKKKDYEALLHKKHRNEALDIPANLQGWRQDVVGDFLLESIKNMSV